MKIFLSHCSERKPIVREFIKELPDFLHTWLDEKNLTWGETFPEKIEKIITVEVDFLIVFFDENWHNSEWVKQELEWAIQREQKLKRIFILPILLPKADIDSLPSGFSDRLRLSLSDWEAKSVRQLAKNAVEQLFKLVVESYAGEHRKRKKQQIGQSQISIERLPEKLKDESISILMALSKAKFESKTVLTSKEELSKLVDLDASIIDYHIRKLEKDRLIFLASQTGETAITDEGIDYLAENREQQSEK